jgi:hypothetical protein
MGAREGDVRGEVTEGERRQTYRKHVCRACLSTGFLVSLQKPPFPELSQGQL